MLSLFAQANNTWDWPKLIEAMIWPLTTLIILALFYKKVACIFDALVKRIEMGSELKMFSLSVGVPPKLLEGVSADELVTDKHVALMHSCWRYPKKDKDFGRPMYVVHVIIEAQENVLLRIEHVTYHLPGWPNPEQKIMDRVSRFKLKELAWGEFTIRADVKVKGQEKLISLSRYINLTATGPRI